MKIQTSINIALLSLVGYQSIDHPVDTGPQADGAYRWTSADGNHAVNIDEGGIVMVNLEDDYCTIINPHLMITGKVRGKARGWTSMEGREHVTDWTEWFTTGVEGPVKALKEAQRLREARLKEANR